MNTIQKKIQSVRSLVAISRRARRDGKAVVVTNGCFDIVHAGHVQNLAWMKAKGDLLIVGINSDASVRRNKGPGRPIVSEQDRALVLAALASVDYVFIFNEKDPIRHVEKLRPAVYAKGKGSEKHPAFPPMEKLVKASGGRVILFPQVKGRSTSDIIQTILRRDRERR